jgi:hypothetical protein
MRARREFMQVASLRRRPIVDSISEDNDMSLNHTSVVSQCSCSLSLCLDFEPSHSFPSFDLFSPSLFFHAIQFNVPIAMHS